MTKGLISWSITSYDILQLVTPCSLGLLNDPRHLSVALKVYCKQPKRGLFKRSLGLISLALPVTVEAAESVAEAVTFYSITVSVYSRIR